MMTDHDKASKIFWNFVLVAIGAVAVVLTVEDTKRKLGL